MTLLSLLAALSAAIWLYMLLARGGFWMSNVRDIDVAIPPPRNASLDWPAVTAIIPARNEADGIANVVAALLKQDYDGPFSILLVDDQSNDGTAEKAHEAAISAGAAGRLAVVTGQALEAGWTGKLFALQQGLEAVNTLPEPPDYVWLTDADISYTADALFSLVSRAEANSLVLTSLMAKLRCTSIAERLLIPAFIFFFQMLYPFAWVNRASSKVAAAAGGCMLVRRDALNRIGGFGAIKGALIDDCSLGRALKAVGPIWLGLSDRALSLRPYETFGDIRQMVSRSAYAQLHYSPLYLAGTALGMLLVYGLPPALAIFGQGSLMWLGVTIWLLMAALYAPTLIFYRQSPVLGLALPLIALIYLAFTFDSAYQHSQGRGGMWKGRAQAARG